MTMLTLRDAFRLLDEVRALMPRRPCRWSEKSEYDNPPWLEARHTGGCKATVRWQRFGHGSLFITVKNVYGAGIVYEVMIDSYEIPYKEKGVLHPGSSFDAVRKEVTSPQQAADVAMALCRDVGGKWFDAWLGRSPRGPRVCK